MFTRRRWAGWLTGCFLQGVLRLLAAHAGPPAEAASDAHLSVGMTGQIDQLILPGSELEVRPLEDRRAPFVLRIKDVYPHGSAFRYDLVYYALEPGRYDLRNYLRRKDGSALGELPPVLVQVDPILPPGQVEPSPLELAPSPRLGGYRWLLALGGSLWCAGLVAIVVLGRRRVSEAVSNAGKPATLADRLKPLVDAAVAGTLDQGQQAELERLLIGYWRKRLGLEQQTPSGAMAASVLIRRPEGSSARSRNGCTDPRPTERRTSMWPPCCVPTRTCPPTNRLRLDRPIRPPNRRRHVENALELRLSLVAGLARGAAPASGLGLEADGRRSGPAV